MWVKRPGHGRELPYKACFPSDSGRSSTEDGVVRISRTGSAPMIQNTRPRAWQCIFRKMVLVRPPHLACLPSICHLQWLSYWGLWVATAVLAKTSYPLQTVPSASSHMHWPEEAACTFTAPSADTSSAAAATMPFMPRMWAQGMGKGNKGQGLPLCLRGGCLGYKTPCSVLFSSFAYSGLFNIKISISHHPSALHAGVPASPVP